MAAKAVDVGAVRVELKYESIRQRKGCAVYSDLHRVGVAVSYQTRRSVSRLQIENQQRTSDSRERGLTAIKARARLSIVLGLTTESGFFLMLGLTEEVSLTGPSLSSSSELELLDSSLDPSSSYALASRIDGRTESGFFRLVLEPVSSTNECT